ncbi:DUF4390 domain-containing protein [bacterium]|nr:MAG: DUF4390 domain-containing protein [bacterium]
MAFLLFPSTVLSTEISGPTVITEDENILVSTGLSYLGKLESTIGTGIEKKIVFTMELFRVWDLWPDEFVISKKIKRTIRYDNLRGLYFVTSRDGDSLIQKKFNDFHTMKAWAFKIEEIHIANMRELEPGNYYVKVLVESKSKKLPAVIGILMLFVPEVEMVMTKESKPFNVEGIK